MYCGGVYSGITWPMRASASRAAASCAVSCAMRCWSWVVCEDASVSSRWSWSRRAWAAARSSRYIGLVVVLHVCGGVDGCTDDGEPQEPAHQADDRDDDAGEREAAAADRPVGPLDLVV